jgi:hypothetical protein
MPAKSLTVTLPEPLLERIRGQARRSKRTVEAEVVRLLSEAIGAAKNGSKNGSADEKPRTKRGESADAVQDELPPDIQEAMVRIESLDDRALHKALKPIMTKRQADRLAELNRKAQDEGLSDAEEAESDQLLHVYDKSVIVRSAAMAELHKRGFDVAKLIAK